MRQMEHKNPYLHEGQVRKKVVSDALEFLAKEELLTALSIKVNDNNVNILDNAQKLIDDEINKDIDANLSAQQHNQNEEIRESDDESEEETNFKSTKQIHETLLVDQNSDLQFCAQLVVSQNTNDKDTDEETVQSHKIAPGETSYPVNYLFDKHVEELSFIKLFGGKIMRINNQDITFGGKCKSFFRRYDRRCANNIQYLFFMYRKLMATKLQASINLSVRRTMIDQQLTANKV